MTTGDVLEILQDGHPMLRERMVEQPVADMSDPTASHVARMLEATMMAADGIGLAANQAGLHIRAFAIHLRSGLVATLFNPRIATRHAEVRIGEEACLSYPGLRLKVKRHAAITIAYQDGGARNRTMDLEGVDAVCAQHEMDHLDGIVFTDRVSPLVLRMARRRMVKGAGHPEAGRRMRGWDKEEKT